jgi:phage tail-like protein
MATAVPRNNPYAAFNFIVSISGDVTAGFMEVSGLDGENMPIEYREGDDQKGNDGAFVTKQPGLERYPNVTLRRGITGSTRLWTLRKEIREGKAGVALQTGKATATGVLITIALQNEVHSTVFKWKLQNAWISKLSGPSLNAKSNEIAVESVEIVCERIEVDDS